MAETTGGAVLARMLREEGVEKFFGIVDGTYTQLFVHCVELGIEMIYNVGAGGKVQSSSWLIEKAAKISTDTKNKSAT